MINVALVGNPNTGKTTLYNNLTSSHEHVGNWHGVTVEEKGKVYKYNSEEINLVDLPGIYSLSPLSYEEEVGCKFLLDKSSDLIVNICDASNLKRNLYLTLSLMEMGAKVVLVVNQIDKRPICRIDVPKLSALLGIKIVHVNAGDKKAAKSVNDAILEAYKHGKTEYNLPYLKGLDLTASWGKVKDERTGKRLFYAVKLLEDDQLTKERFKVREEFGKCEEIASLRYEYIDKVLEKCCSKNQRVYGRSKLDKIFLNRFLALPVFLCLIAVAFYLTFFSVGSWLSSALSFLLESCISKPITTFLIRTFGGGSWIVGLFENAIIGGVGSIVSFLPQVGLLFFFLSLLEDSGYLSRVAFVFDDLLAKVGLSGKAVYTLLMGFGCSTSAVLTARNMEDKNSKIKTALLTPYMSCSAKFPIYSVLGGAFFGAKNIWVILGLYIFGVIVAVLISFILEKTALKSKQQSFILEFPPYRMMSFKRTISLLWQNIKLFLSRVASIILAMNVIVWVLSSFSIKFQYVAGGEGVSILETLGRVLSPLFIPVGFGSWGLVAALLAGLVAKEVIVSSIAMFNGVEDGSISSIQSSILGLSAAAGFVSASSLLSYLVFCLLYVPCLATTSVLSKEIGGKWTALSIVIELFVAYLASFIVYNFASAIEVYGVSAVMILLGSLAIIIFSLVFVFKRVKKKKLCPYAKDCKKNCKNK